jgi:glucose/arabinose dehydrogenase
LLVAFAFTGLVSLTLPATAQQPAPAPAPKEEEVPFWAIGKPKGGPGAALAPVPAFPIATPADKLPIAKMKLPPGFKAEVYAANVLDARGLRQGDKGTVFVSSLFVAGKVYAIVDKGGTREVKTVLEKIELPNGIEFHKGSLYVATPKAVTRYDNIEATLDKPNDPVKIYDDLPGEIRTAGSSSRSDRTANYLPVGAPCSICDPSSDKYAHIRRINLDGSGVEIVARGVRNTVASTSILRPASCGSPTTSATGCRRTCPTTSSTT